MTVTPPATPRRRRITADRASAAVAAGIVLNAARLRPRLLALKALDPPADGDTSGAAGAGGRDWQWLVLAGTTVDEATRRAAEAHAASEGLDALDLVPGDLPVEPALDLVRRVDPAGYREARLHAGVGALHAIVATAELLERCDLTPGDARSPLEMLRATEALKLHAATGVDLAVAPGLRAAASDPSRDTAVVEKQYGRALPILSLVPLAHQALLSRGARRRSAAGLAAVTLHALQPHVVFAGAPVRPRDLTPTQGFGRLGRQARRTWNDLARHQWGPDREAVADIEAKRPDYQAELALGSERLFEPRRDDCPMCASADIHHLVRSRDLIQGKPGTFDLDECRSCRHVFQNPRLSVEGLDFYYRDFYDGIGAEGAEMLFASDATPYLGRARMLRGHAEPRRWLDVGGGHGHFTLVAAGEWPKTTFDLLDMSDSVDEAQRRGWVSNGYRGFFPDLAAELAGSYDVVSMHHYLEHTRDPLAELDAAHEVLEPGGHLLIEVPNPDDPIARPLGWLWGPWFQPQHQHFMTRRNLTRELEKRGFTVVETHVSEAHQPVDVAFAGWLLANRLAPAPPMPWNPPLSVPQRMGRVAAFAALAPLIAVGLVFDRVAAPVMRRIPGRSNTYRVLARRD